MMARPTIACVAFAAGLALAGAAWTRMSVAATQTNPDVNTLPSGVAPAAGDPVPIAPNTVVIEPAPPNTRTPAPPRETSGNPLWGVSLKVLNATRERPLFLPSRRAPPAAVAGPPEATPVVSVAIPPATAPEHPHLVLIGAIVGETESFAVFLDETTREVVRLKTGESRGGWILFSVRAREATLKKDRESILLSLPAPNDQPAQRTVNSNSDNL